MIKILIFYHCISVFLYFFFLMIRRPPRSTQGVSSAASDVYKRQSIDRSSTAFEIRDKFKIQGRCCRSLEIHPKGNKILAKLACHKLFRNKFSQLVWNFFSAVSLVFIIYAKGDFQSKTFRDIQGRQAQKVLGLVGFKGSAPHAQLYHLVTPMYLSLIHISEPTRPLYISYAVFCLKKKNKNNQTMRFTN
eukprot:TRINITY_DN26787_c0_g1_i1.p1 TRINITY_DN26787_c0_g1~~TRINITY_DN26787_c0_g1_i1.p1  ORF type:complete len:190 (+),score=39.50 TRINITY_DN26787_c0_g1_i1:60-629(+)